jgi:hydroxyacylglutathione hydrolase
VYRCRAAGEGQNVRITEHIALVGSGRLGLRLTSPFDCNIYLVSSGPEAALIDAGCGLADQDIARRIADLSPPGRSVSRILVTHSHADHAAGAARLRGLLGARVCAPAASTEAMRAGDTEKSLFAAARAAGSYPSDLEYPLIPVDEPIGAGDTWPVGDLVLEAIAAPGHSYDHTVYLLRGAPVGPVLFGGDLILSDGRVLLLASEDCRLDQYAATMKTLCDLRIAALMPGHGAFLYSGASEVLERASAQFDRLVPPPSLT